MPSKLPYWLITLSAVLILSVSYLIQDAMFQDAMLYSSVSHNLGTGIGTYWFPQYSTLNIAGLSSFHEHPPLVFWIQSVFYRIFGDSIYIERFYTLGMIIITILLINHLWKLATKELTEYTNYGWLPVLLWILVPAVMWNYRYNMLENTMAIFVLLSFITSYYNLKNGNKLHLWFLSGFFVFLSSFCKGIPGLFIVVVPSFYWLVTRKISFSKAVLYSVILIGVPAIIYAILLQFPDSRQNLTTYFFKRVLWRIDLLPTANYRLEILVHTFMELLLMIILSVIAYGFSRKRKIDIKFKEPLFFVLTGLAGVLPLALTFCQRAWYLVPTFPFFSIGFGLFMIPFLSYYFQKIDSRTHRFKIFRTISIIIFVGAIIYTGLQKGKIGRDPEIVTDVYKIGAVVPKFSTITVPKEMYNQYDFILQGFLVRYFNISISPMKEYDYFMTEKAKNYPIPSNYQKVNLPLLTYDLYKRK